MGGRKYLKTYELVDDDYDDDYEEEDGYEVEPKRRPSRKPSRPSRGTKETEGTKGEKGGNKALLVIETLLLVGAIAYCVFVVTKFNQIQIESEVVHAENKELSEQLEAVAPKDDGQEFSTYVLIIWAADAEVVPNGDTMDLTVRATVYNDSLLELDNEHVPDLICGGFHFKGSVEGADSIGMFHGQGNIVWKAEGIPANTQGIYVAFDETHLVYYNEKVAIAVEARRAEAFGWV